jgi:hypothetical protein
MWDKICQATTPYRVANPSLEHYEIYFNVNPQNGHITVNFNSCVNPASNSTEIIHTLL